MCLEAVHDEVLHHGHAAVVAVLLQGGRGAARAGVGAAGGGRGHQTLEQVLRAEEGLVVGGGGAGELLPLPPAHHRLDVLQLQRVHQVGEPRRVRGPRPGHAAVQRGAGLRVRLEVVWHQQLPLLAVRLRGDIVDIYCRYCRYFRYPGYLPGCRAAPAPVSRPGRQEARGRTPRGPG